MVWPDTNYHTIALSSTKCHTMFWGRLPFVTLSFGYGTKFNNILALKHCNNITVTTTNVDTSAKCNTVVYDNTCCTKCNNNDWSYSGNNAKCGTIVVTVLLLWSYLGNGAKCISIKFVYQSSLCPRCVWKINRQGITQSIRNFFWLSGRSVGTKLPGVGNSKTRTHRQQLTIVYCSVFRQHTVEREREREKGREKERERERKREREREFVRVC